MGSRSSWSDRLRRLWFFFKSLPIRARFLTGKASFVEADIRMTTNSVTELSEPSGLARGSALLAHFQLETHRPRAGSQGWRLYEERVGLGPRHRTAVLECGYCRHHFVIQILSALDPLSSEATGGRPPARPASYTAEWFRFMHIGFDGDSRLYCFHCEQDGPARVSFL